MYWPSGVPRVYGYDGPKTRPPQDDGEDLEDDGNDASPERSSSAEEASALTLDLKRPENTTPSGQKPTEDNSILALRLTHAHPNHPQFFTALTSTTLNFWSVRPILLLSTLARSRQSLTTYGQNQDILFRPPDSRTLVLRTSKSYLLTYTLESDPASRIYQQTYETPSGSSSSSVRRSSSGRGFDTEEHGVPEVNLRFRRAIKIDAGINAVLALDAELLVATTRPAAVQCIPWEPDREGPKARGQANAQLLSKMGWIGGAKTSIVATVSERAMNLMIWIMGDGRAFAVQGQGPRAKNRRKTGESQDGEDGVNDEKTPTEGSSTTTKDLFYGYQFHPPPADLSSESDNSRSNGDLATHAAINARFSLLAIATSSNKIFCYTAKDYAGNLPLSHKFRLPGSPSTTGALTALTWSPDGYCLFAGFEHGWATWSVFGCPGANSFNANPSHALAHLETWLLSIQTASWTTGGGGGVELILTCVGDSRIWRLDMSRSAATGCFSGANLVRALLQSPLELTLYRGHELPDLTSVVGPPNEASLWHHARYPAAYFHAQAPIKSAVVSPDGRYIAVAGRRGLAHYSVSSGRWKTFANSEIEASFAVRGGMCWFKHVLAVATESARGYDVRLYSRDRELGRNALAQEVFAGGPVVFIGPSGEESLLVYTYENTLYHYVINFESSGGAQLVQVGQIALHGVVRAPSRVRSVSWILPDAQMRSGDPSRDVEYAAVLFLVDDKLVLLQPLKGAGEDEGVRYDMRVVAHQVEYYILMRDQIYFNFTSESVPGTPDAGQSLNVVSRRNTTTHSLRDSLWIFCGEELRMWSDVKDILRSALEEDATKPLSSLSIPLDFYPLSILLNKGVVLGIESELLQRRDVGFAQYRSVIRSQLFIPYLLRQQLCEGSDGMPAALAMASQYQHLSYFPHAVEILLHTVLDEEGEREHGSIDMLAETKSRLPTILSFMQMVLTPSKYLSTIVLCIRKTEVTAWQTLFAHLPPPMALFEQALELEDLKTASGYLIVLQGLEEEDEEGSDSGGDVDFETQVVRLMKVAAQKGDFELCSEVARFLIAIDPRGGALKRVVEATGFNDGTIWEANEPNNRYGLGLSTPSAEAGGAEGRSLASRPRGYFSATPSEAQA